MSRTRSIAARLAVATIVMFGLVAGMRAGEARAGDPCQYFPETDRSVCGPFREYWLKHGGLAQQGFPISDEMEEKSDTNGKTYTMQYFERARFEYHPENNTSNIVQLSLLGALLYNVQYPGGAEGEQPNTSSGSVVFKETSKRLGGIFLQYWKAHGGLAQQGLPISDEFVARSPLDGKEYRVQYFERAVFESHPEKAAPYNVLLSQLGTFRYHDKYGANAGKYPGKIVYDMRSEQGSVVFVINPDGTGRAKIGPGLSPIFSPDGTRIAYLAVKSTEGFGEVAIRTAAVDGSGQRDYCTTAGNAQFDLVRWSPDNSYIAVNIGQGPPGAMYLCDLSTGKLSGSPVATKQGGVSAVYDWTPDGKFALWQAGNVPTFDLYYGDAAKGGTDAVRLTNGNNRPNLFGLRYY